jgi:predicted nucleotidyltransferase
MPVELTNLEKQVKRYAVMLEGLPDSAANYGLLAIEFNIDQVRCIRVFRSFARWEWAKTAFDRLQCNGDVDRLIIGQSLQCTVMFGRAKIIPKQPIKNNPIQEQKEAP